MVRVELVFRTIGERTSAQALDLAVRHIQPDRVHVLEHVAPFWAAVQQSLSLPFQCDYVVSMDADCLILEDMRPFLNANGSAHVDACVLDKFRGWAPAGVHVSRIDLVQAMRGVQTDPGDPEYYLKPESWTRFRALQQLGEIEELKRFRILHDFEQEYEHLFIKYVTRDLRSRKWHKQLRLDRQMARQVVAGNGHDPDMTVVRYAVEYARQTFWPTSGHKMRELLPTLPGVARRELQKLGLAKKPALERSTIEELCASAPVQRQFAARPAKVFGLGLSPDALKRLVRELEALGFNIAKNADLGPILDNPGHPAARLPGMEDWDGLAGIRLAPFYRQLDEAYPEARFILVVGRMDEWLDEVEAVRERPDSRLAWSMAQILQVGSLADPTCSPGRLAQGYEAYRQHVLDAFQDRPGRLLFLDLAREGVRRELVHFLEPVLPRIGAGE